MTEAKPQGSPPAPERGHPRGIRSFMRREGRTTAAQLQALEELWPRYGILPSTGHLDLEALFPGQSGPLALEIGFGDGTALAMLAEQHPEQRHLGVEVYAAGVGRLMRAAAQHGLDNLRIAQTDAVEFLRERVPPSALDQVLVWFPDPWPKKRHHKRRLIQPAFLALLAERLRPGGSLMLATDWEDYARHMLQAFAACPQFINLANPGPWSARPAERPLTRFERRGQALGHAVFDLSFQRV